MSKRYRNASEILPDELLKELQKYAPGELLYIPKSETRSEWGKQSGAWQFYQMRNSEIRKRYFEQSVSVFALSVAYGLSEDTIRKILYAK
jgi:hypothetical protein